MRTALLFFIVGIASSFRHVAWVPGAASASHRERETRVELDIFGLGPAEVVIIAGAAALLYGPGRLKEQLREKGVKGTVVSKGFKAEREERVLSMLESANLQRKRRAWERVNLSLSQDEDGEVARRLAAYERSTQDNNEETE